MLRRPSGAAHLGLAVFVLSAGDPDMNERLLEQIRRLDRTPRPVGLWETVTNDPPRLAENVEPDPKYL